MTAWKSKIVGHGRVAPGSIRLNPLNYRRHPDKQTQALADAIAALGFIRSVTINKRSGNLVDGHARVEEAIKADAPWVDVEYVDLSPEEEAQALATLDPIGELATVDPVAFDRLLREFDAGAESLQGLLAEIADDAGLYRDQADAQPEIVAERDGAVDVIEDGAPDEPPAEPTSRPGDLWILGRHRLLCGDSAISADLDRLLGDDKVDTVISDPPYGVAHDCDYTRITRQGKPNGRKHEPIANDDRPFDPSPWLAYKRVVLFGANCFSDRLPIGTWLVWDKRFANGKAMLSDAEVAWMRGGHGVYLFAETTQGAARSEPAEHPTQKPVAVIAWCMRRAKAGPIVLDPFLGSGTTLIAAEQLNRRCLGLEISPAYCDVIVRRWETFTGRKAERRSAEPGPAE